MILIKRIDLIIELEYKYVRFITNAVFIQIMRFLYPLDYKTKIHYSTSIDKLSFNSNENA